MVTLSLTSDLLPCYYTFNYHTKKNFIGLFIYYTREYAQLQNWEEQINRVLPAYPSPTVSRGSQHTMHLRSASFRVTRLIPNSSCCRFIFFSRKSIFAPRSDVFAPRSDGKICLSGKICPAKFA